MKYRPGFIQSVITIGLLYVSVIAALALAADPAAAGNSAPEDEWRFGIGLYGWYGDIEGDAANGSAIDISARDLIDDLEFGFMAAMGAQKGRWGLMIDLIYLDVEDSRNDSVAIGGASLGVNTRAEVENWIVTSAIGYRVSDANSCFLDIIGGVRYLSADAEAVVRATSAAGPGPVIASASDSGSIWDGIVGFKGQLFIAESWYLPFYLDLGTGESDFTLQAMVGIGYSFDPFAVILSYRYLSWDFDDSGVLDDMDISGPLLGVKYTF